MKWVIWILMPALLAGCRSGRETGRALEKIEMPGHWVSGKENPPSPVAQCWWCEFGGEALEKIVEAALDRNPDLAVLAARVESAAANARISGADLYPGVTLNLDRSRRRQNFIGFPIPGQESRVLTTRSSNYQLLFNTTWEIDLWGRIRAAKKAALADLAAGDADFGAAQLSLIANVAKAWVQAIASQKQLELAATSAASFHETAAKIRDRYEMGLRSSLDLRLAENSAEGAEALVHQRRLERQRALEQLEVLVGRYPSASITIQDDLPELVSGVPVGLPSELLARRPDLKAAERRLAAADHRIWQARAALFPRISLTASGGTSSDELNGLLDTDLTVWSIVNSAAQPLFQGGRLLANIDLSKARSREAAAQYLSAVLQAFEDVEGALAGEEHLGKRERHLRAAARQSRASLAEANRRYQNGLVEFINVLESQRRSLTDATQVIEIKRLRLSNRIDLHLALGGGFDETDPEPAEPGAKVALVRESGVHP